MCWNQKISLNTFLLSLFGISLAYFNSVINFYEYLYFLSFISIQLVEYFTWANLNDKKINTFLSKIGLFLIFIQPIFSTLSCDIDNKLKTWIIALYLVFSIFCYLVYFPIDFSMNKAQNGHLAWNWLNFPIILNCIWLSFVIGVILYQKKYLKFCVYLIVVLAIYYTYYKTKTWGSLWCWFANILAVQLIFKVFFDLKLSNCLIVKK
jgi:hypothetical protein